MNKNTVYIAVFAVLCVLAGALVGASIVKTILLPPGRDFAGRAEHFMRPWPEGPGEMERHDGLFDVLTNKLNLDENQKVKIKEILEKTRREIDDVGKNVRNAISGIKHKTDKQIMEVLTPDQQEKFKRLINDFEKFKPNGPRDPRFIGRNPSLDKGSPPFVE